MIDPITAGETADWVKYILTCFGGAIATIGGIYGLIIHRQAERIDGMNAQVVALIAASEERTQKRVEERHAENLRAFSDHRQETREGNAALLTEVKELRNVIAEDRRREIDRLVDQIKTLEGKVK